MISKLEFTERAKKLKLPEEEIEFIIEMEEDIEGKQLNVYNWEVFLQPTPSFK